MSSIEKYLCLPEEGVLSYPTCNSGPTSDEDEDEDDSESGYDSNSDSDTLTDLEDDMSDDNTDSRHCWEDVFPYESVLFGLGDHYRLTERLSTIENDAIVYSAIHRASGDPVVIKFMNGLDKEVPKNIRILTNAKGSASIIQLREWFRFEDKMCYALVLDYKTGHDTRLMWGDPKQIQSFTKQLLLAIKALHDQNVIYRDVKFENILWNKDSQTLVLIDFDISTFLDPDHLHRSYVGTDGYFAPETTAIYNAIKNGDGLPYKGYSQKIDMWGIGVVLLSLLYRIAECEIMNEYCESLQFDVLLRTLKKDCNDADADSMVHLCKQLLTKDPSVRVDVDQALRHPCLAKEYNVGL
jgi:serine/threonine protein kinase